MIRSLRLTQYPICKVSFEMTNYENVFSKLGLSASTRLMRSLEGLEETLEETYQFFGAEDILALDVKTPFFPWRYVPLAWAEFSDLLMLEVSSDGKHLEDRLLIYEPIDNYLYIALEGDGLSRTEALSDYREDNLHVPNIDVCSKSEFVFEPGRYDLGAFSVMRNGQIFSVHNTDFERPGISFSGPSVFERELKVSSMFQSSFWEDAASGYLKENDLERARRCYMNAVEVILCSDDRSGYGTALEQRERVVHLVSLCKEKTGDISSIYDHWFFDSILSVTKEIPVE